MPLVGSWAALVGDSAAAQACCSGLLGRWSEPHRRYHGLAHLLAVLAITDRYAAVADDPVAVGLAAWFHDAVYDPTRADNETLSARLAAAELVPLGVPAALIAEVVRLVLVTVTHSVRPGDSNAALLCSADLSVLAGPGPVYAEYAAAVRAEYSHIGDADFRAGRAAVLRGLLARPVLFGVPALARLWEDRARANMAAELAQLQ